MSHCLIRCLHIIRFPYFFVVNLDDCWQVSRDAQGTIQADPALFPNGIPPMVDYIHARKLKFGLYSGVFCSYVLSHH